MTDYIDITLPISPSMPVWPGSLAIGFDRVSDLHNGDEHTETDIHMSAHTGTHIDAPSHYIRDGKHLSEFPMDKMIGPALVVEILDVDVITESDLANLNIPADTNRLLIKTRNSSLWANPNHEFTSEFVALDKSAAQWLVDFGLDVIGVDYLSIQPFEHGPETHQIILGAEIIAIEGLNLSAVAPGNYELLCLPLRLVDTEAAPARVLLRKL